MFVDIECDTYNIDTSKIEKALTKKTTAIMPVHVYGNPCNHKEISDIANKYNLSVIYDAAHSFGVKQNNTSIVNFGDLSCLSFHATKAYSTIEGGAIVSHDSSMKKKIDNLKNFGIISETEIIEPGLNGKLNELQAAYGLANLTIIDNAIERRKVVAAKYDEAFYSRSGIITAKKRSDIKYNYSYYPIIIEKEKYGMSRDDLYFKLKENKIFSRRYFYPLISDLPMYKNLPSANSNNLPVAKKVSDSILCLPIHHDLTDYEIERVTKHIL